MPYSPNTRLPIALCAAILVAIFSVSASAEEAERKPTAWYISTFSGYTYGEVHEIVWLYDDILSELVWPEKPLWTIGIAGRLQLPKGISFHTEFATGIPGANERMTDSDWMNLYADPQSYEKTHYSEHDTTITHAIRLEAGCTIPIADWQPAGWKLSLDGDASVRYAFQRWEGYDGYIQYAENPGFPGGDNSYTPWSESVTKDYLTGPVINYRYHQITPLLTASFRVEPASTPINFTVSFAFSPYTWMLGIDEHLIATPPTTYHDYMHGLLFEPSIVTGWKINDRFTAQLSARWTWVPRYFGDDYAEDTTDGSITLYENTAGASVSELTIRLGAEYRLH